ncbi:ferrous iron transport protein B [Anaerosphaera aminiphila DSM 21120]|uniref:Ferrous iron transport protein B n=1 Tax=Anaerosphaera aminiphila DSM 21120 TaxID=1120995 RepID=A0A1M5UPA8_9FIRM|nr:ferrous iron transport protein B [Anaerosphaera aminiphila]SHH64824.1 ferrous iron transport protein B [Anaerosphaera aminiphila DSM 21120]
MGITIALAGNPNSGKTTLFNALTGSYQYVGNWPGVTVEKKTGEYKKNREIKITDLPGIYSLSPYTLEEVVSRDYLLKERPDVIVDVIDASNIERNLYLATQLSELGIPLVLALNMMDVVKKNGDVIDSKKLEKLLNCRVVEISAIKNENLDELIRVAVEEAEQNKEFVEIETFSSEAEKYISEIESLLTLKDNVSKRWVAIKLFESDSKIGSDIEISKDVQNNIDKIIERAEEEFDDDGEGIITDERYNFVTDITNKTVKKGRKGLTTSDKADKILTNRFLALPIFVVIMVAIYYVSMTVVGGPVTDWVNDVFFGEIIGGNVVNFLEGAGVAEWMVSLIGDGIIAGVGGVLGFLPIIAVLFFFIAILEDVGYMSRIAFILDKLFRKFGLSGKSFIPILIGTGCSVPGIIGTRTIENDNDRRMTITVASFMPCGAKTDIIALFAAFLGGYWWYAPIWYFGGIAAVAITGIMLKKTKLFTGDPAPFVMELPEYHMPKMNSVLKATWNRCKAFIIKAGTIILLCTVAIWVLKNISIHGEFMEFDGNVEDSLLAFIGKKLQWIFAPLGFGDWIATIATVLGLIAKEVVVGTYGVVMGLGEVGPESPGLAEFVASNFSTVSAVSFMFFNQFTIPCFAAVGAMREEMNSKKWLAFAVGYQIVFSYTVALMIYQFGRVLVLGEAFNIWTGIAIVILFVYLYFIFRPNRYKDEHHVVKRSVKE